MSECVICDKKFEKNILFEDDQIIMMLAIEPAVNGHIQIFPKKHFSILEQADQNTLDKMVSAANKISIILFEALKVHGTNIIINNGVPAGQKIPHLSIDILPRRSDDNLKLDWTLKQATPEALDSMHRIIGEGMNIPQATPIITREPEVIKFNKSEENNTDNSTNDNSNNNDENIPKEYTKPREKKTNFHHQLFERIP